ncbi:hypothetical protein CMI37_38930 [Candidatus Pacearchaeota archaeon]|nr:hypothetical protein [Candidatus Pacearchaeota archaeon]|tara:strand:- start:157 stop:777 length:621 start_codon:yes stop_codon:yes gene_type:complete
MSVTIDLHRKTFCMFGLRGTGKSTNANFICNSFGRKALVYDTLDEVPINAKYDSYLPKVRNSSPELETVIRKVKNSHYELFLIDEANRYCPSKPSPLPQEVADINDQCRHYNLALGYIARRPCQLNQDLTELADYLIIYHLKGKADIQYLNNLSQGLGKAVLILKKYQFILVMPDRSFKLMHEIEPDKLWLKRADAHIKGVSSHDR